MTCMSTEMDEEIAEIDFAEHCAIPLPLPHSNLYHVRQSSTSGRGVFASKSLFHGTTLLDTDNVKPNEIALRKFDEVEHAQEYERAVSSQLQSPLAYTILREYRKEVCGECFLYDRGREWRVKFDLSGLSLDDANLEELQASGIVFCTETCRTAWTKRYGIIGIRAFAALEIAVRKAVKRNSSTSTVTVTEEQQRKADTRLTHQKSNGKVEAAGDNPSVATDRDQTSDKQSTNSPNTQKGPSLESIREAWQMVARKTATIATLRTKAQLSKADRKLHRTASEPETIDSDLGYYLVTGVLHAYLAGQKQQAEEEKSATRNPPQISNSRNKHNNVDDNRNASEAEATARSSNACDTDLQDTDLLASDSEKSNHHLHQQTDTSEHPPPPRTSYTTKTTTTTTTTTSSSSQTNTTTLLPGLLTLTPDQNSYAHPSSTLEKYTTSFLLLHTILPTELTRHLTPTLSHELNSRASHNAFSIRPLEESDGIQSGEFLGWGVWPAASFFNHSCTPNVGKRRTGRAWQFFIDHPPNHNGSCADDNGNGNIPAGEELCITYLGGDERDLDLVERRNKLREGWGFECMCKRCVHEEAMQATKTS